jgi:hypothetical protein
MIAPLRPQADLPTGVTTLCHFGTVFGPFFLRPSVQHDGGQDRSSLGNRDALALDRPPTLLNCLQRHSARDRDPYGPLNDRVAQLCVPKPPGFRSARTAWKHWS